MLLTLSPQNPVHKSILPPRRSSFFSKFCYYCMTFLSIAAVFLRNNHILVQANQQTRSLTFRGARSFRSTSSVAGPFTPTFSTTKATTTTSRRNHIPLAFVPNHNDSQSTTRSSVITPISFPFALTTKRNMATSVDEDAKKALLSCPTLTLKNGMAHPAIGFGTYKVGFIPASASAATAGQAQDTSKERTARECVLDALKLGYRMLECAEFYGNEAEVGKAIADSGIDRKELFLCSKVWTTTIEQGPAAIEAQLNDTLQKLGTDYVDLYLVHWPVPGHHVQAYQTLEKLQQQGKIQGIGVSNYAVEDIQELLDAGCSTPLVNQIEINPFLYRKNTIQKCQDWGIVMQSYRSLRDGKAMDHPTLVELAKKYNKSVAQILGRWCVQKGFVYLPKSVKTERMKENGQVFDFELTKEDMATLDALTTPENLQTFQGLYRKCVNRDTSKDGTMDGVKMEITLD